MIPLCTPMARYWMAKAINSEIKMPTTRQKSLPLGKLTNLITTSAMAPAARERNYRHKQENKNPFEPKEGGLDKTATRQRKPAGGEAGG